MLYWLIPIILIIISTIALVVLVIRKIPQLRVIDVESTAEEKLKQMKETLIMERVRRLTGGKLGGVSKKAGSGMKVISKMGRRTVQKLTALERHYQDLKKQTGEGVHATDPDVVKRMLSQASDLVREERFGEAENKYIEIISHNPKSIPAYEDLGRLYIKMKQYNQAKEAFNFILKIKDQDASVSTSLGEIALLENNPKLALEYFEKAVVKRPANPRYLDFMIEAALLAGQVEPARRGIDQLRKVNPENQKIEEFEERFIKLDVAPKEKVESNTAESLQDEE